MASLRRWLLSRQAQLTIQLSVSLIVTSLFTLWSPIHFRNACLVPVFVAVVVGSLAQDQHIGTRLQVSAWVLGPTWVAAILAGSLMSLAKLAAVGQHGHSMSAGYVALTAVLALLGLALLVFLQAVTPPGPGRVMGIIAVLIYGIMVCLSTLYPDISSMWLNAVLNVVLGTVIAAVVGVLVGFLVMPSLASDEVWRLMSEALQGAGTVLSYHTSLLMVDEPTAGPADSSGSKASPPASAASKLQHGSGSAGEGAAGTVRQRSTVNKQQSAQQQQHGMLHHLHHQHHQHQHADWSFQRPRHAPGARSSIDIAAAGAAVVAASQDAHKPAAEAAAVALSWVDAADTQSISSGRSEHSSKYSIASLVGSDAIADAAAEYSKRFQEQQEESTGEESTPCAVKLSEQLLQQGQEQQQQGDTSPPAKADLVDAWVSATAAVAAASISRRGSLATSARVSEDGSATASLSSSYGLGPATQAGTQQRKSLEGAASLDFMEELDDKTFIHMMRVLSHTKGGSMTKPPAGDPAAKPLASRSSQPAAAEGAAGRKGMPHSKSAASGLSALSVDGSSTAPDDWTRAVSPRGQYSSGLCQQQQQQKSKGTAQLRASQLLSALSHGAASTAGSVISSHASVLHPRRQLPLKDQQQQQSFSRFAVPPADQQPPGSFSKRPSIASRAWSLLGQASWTSLVAGKSFAAQSRADSKQVNQQQRYAGQPAGPDDSPFADADVAVADMPPLMQPPTTSAQLQPLVGRAKAALASARLEPWWLRPKALQHFDADACMKLLDDVELLLVRLSTLEGVSEERSLMGLHLHQLAHYKGIADALALIFAQLTAFVMHVSTVVAKQETSNSSVSWSQLTPKWLRRKAAAGKASSSGRQRHLHPQHASSASPAPGQKWGAAVPGKGALQRPSPFASAAVGEVGAGPDADGASMGLSTLLSGMERQGSGVSSYLWEKKTGWGQAREMLKREMDAGLGHYWWSVRKASKHLPVKVPRSREVMILIFLWPICTGVLDACERIETSAQQVLKPSTNGNAQHAAPPGQSGPAGGAFNSWGWFSAAWGSLVSALCFRSAVDKLQQPPAGKQVHSAAVAKHATPCGSTLSKPGFLKRMRSAVDAAWQKLKLQGQWAMPLLQLVLVKPALLAVYQAVTQDVPATLRSKQRIKDMLASRMFQTALKLLFATGSVLLATVLLMAYVPVVASSVPIFGYAAVVLCFQPRVEATVDQAARRVLGTILGACLGLATNSIPHIFEQPFLLLACLALASVVLGVLARPQRRTAIVLALLTLGAVSLCGYEAHCCSPRGGMTPINTFAARMASVCGACIYVALVNRLLLPWYTSDYALEQLADALEQAALLFGSVYESQLERMRLAEIVAGQLKQQGPEALQVHINAAPASSEALAAPALGSPPANNSPACPPAEAAGCGVSPVQALAACEAAEAKLLVVLRQQVLSRLVAVQLSLAKESVSWRRGVLATPPLVLNVLGAMNAVKEALASQRLALAPFTKHGATAMTEQPGPGAAGPGTGMLHTMQHCYSMWALPLHPLWLEILRTVNELTSATATNLRRPPHGKAARAAARAQLTAKLELLEAQRLDLRHGWLDIRIRLHRAVHGGKPWTSTGATAGDGGSFWPTDSVHLFTFTYGVSRCLNAFAATAQAVANSLVG